MNILLDLDRCSFQAKILQVLGEGTQQKVENVPIILSLSNNINDSLALSFVKQLRLHHSDQKNDGTILLIEDNDKQRGYLKIDHTYCSEWNPLLQSLNELITFRNVKCLGTPPDPSLKLDNLPFYCAMSDSSFSKN